MGATRKQRWPGWLAWARLRDQVDLDTLTAEVLAVVDQTMAPTRMSLWLRPPAARAGS